MAKGFRPEDVEVAQRTSRQGGAVGGENPIVPRIVPQYAQKHHRILDFGAGKQALQAAILRKKGFNVTAYDHTVVPGIHDPNALNHKYDVVYASNMVNVQNSKHALRLTLDQLHKAVHPQGMLLVNLPGSPRKDAYKGMEKHEAANMVERMLRARFEKVERIPGVGGKHEPVWLAKGPRTR